jgi:hypothetical protein
MNETLKTNGGIQPSQDPISAGCTHWDKERAMNNTNKDQNGLKG